MIDNEFYRRYMFGDKEEEVSFSIFEVTSFYHAMRVKKYIGHVCDLMKQELYLLQDEDEVLLDIDPRKSNTVFCEHSMNIYMHSIISKVGRFPLPEDLNNNFAGRDLFEFQKACVNNDKYISKDNGRYLTFKYTWWGKDDEIFAQQQALKSCMQVLMQELMQEDDDKEVLVKDIYRVIEVIDENTEGLPQRNPDFEDGETSDLALDTIAELWGKEKFVEKAVEKICKHYNIKIKQ